MEEILHSLMIEELEASPAGEKLNQVMGVVENVQRHLAALQEKQGEEKLTLLKIGTVFQIFLVDTLASGKQINQLTEEDWKEIASKVSKYAILEEDQCYSEFVFSMYADYIDLSAKVVSKSASEKNVNNDVMKATVANDLDLVEVVDLVSKGATINTDGTMNVPPNLQQPVAVSSEPTVIKQGDVLENDQNGAADNNITKRI